MISMKFFVKYRVLHISFFLTCMQANSQVPDFSKVPNLYDGDSVNITHLINNGVKISTEKAICWFPKDSLSEEQMKKIADTISRGIILAEKLIDAPLQWQAHPFNEPYTFYFRKDTIISHASSAGFISISFWRIKTGRAPWLHEAMHEMLDTKTGSWNSRISEEYQMKNMPLWLFEGMADYISLQVSRSNNMKWFDVFSRGYQTDTDSLFLLDQKSEKGSYIVSHIGAKGIMPELFSKNRQEYAPAFYHGSCSFVKWIAGKYGIKMLLAAISAFDKEMETIENLSGKHIEELKKQWLDNLKRLN